MSIPRPEDYGAELKANGEGYWWPWPEDQDEYCIACEKWKESIRKEGIDGNKLLLVRKA